MADRRTIPPCYSDACLFCETGSCLPLTHCQQIFLTNGDEQKEGNFVLSFPDAVKKEKEKECGELASQVMNLLNAKGFGKNGRWQGKVAKMSNREQAEAIVVKWAGDNLRASNNECSPVIDTAKDAKQSSVVLSPQMEEEYPSLTLYTFQENPKAYKGLICANYGGVPIIVNDRPPSFVLGQTDRSAEFLAKFPTGRVPALEIHGQDQHLNESNAIADYLSKDQLKGATRRVRAQDNQWIQFSSNQLVPPVSVWVYHALGILPTDEANLEKAKADLTRNLDILNDHLLFRTYLNRERVSTCDIVVFCDLMLAFQHAFDNQFLGRFINVKRWFRTIAKQDQVFQVIGNVRWLAKF